MRKYIWIIMLSLSAFGLCLFSALISAFIILSMQGCQKENNHKRFHQVTYTMYSMNPKFAFGHTEDLNTSGSVDTIYSNTYSVTLDVSEDVFTNEQGITSVISSQVDSLYIRAEYDGKKVEHGFRSTGGPFSVSINLANAK